MGACWDDRSKWEIYNEKIHKHAHSVYFSFAPVISASTHRYVNYFISKSWWWLINRNVNVDFTSWYINLFGLYFFLLPSYCRILSIFTFILSFRKKTYTKYILIYIYVILRVTYSAVWNYFIGYESLVSIIEWKQRT